MRPVLISALAIAAMAPVATAGSLTIVLDFEDAPPSRSVSEMKRELATILKGTGLSFDWRLKGQAAGESFANLVLVKFKGRCVLEPMPWLYDERGPMAFTYS